MEEGVGVSAPTPAKTMENLGWVCERANHLTQLPNYPITQLLDYSSGHSPRSTDVKSRRS